MVNRSLDTDPDRSLDTDPDRSLVTDPDRSLVTDPDRSLVTDPEEMGSGRMFEAVYDQLRAIASQFVRKEHVVSFDATSLVHEAYIRLNREEFGQDQSRFLGYATVAMRRILVERARQLRQIKRGGGRQRVPLSQVSVPGRRAPVDLLDLQAALDELEALNPGFCEIVILRFLLGSTVAEAAQALGISENKVSKDWRFARSWLKTRLARAGE